jgi:hypothetical protein
VHRTAEPATFLTADNHDLTTMLPAARGATSQDDVGRNVFILQSCRGLTETG